MKNLNGFGKIIKVFYYCVDFSTKKSYYIIAEDSLRKSGVGTFRALKWGNACDCVELHLMYFAKNTYESNYCVDFFTKKSYYGVGEDSYVSLRIVLIADRIENSIHDEYN